MAVTAEATDDPSLAFDTCRAFLESRPVEHNIALTIVHERVAHPHEGRYWWTVEADRVSGYAWQSPVTFSAGLTPMSVPAVIALATRVSLDAPGLPGVIAEAGTAAAFAGRWTELRGTGAEPAEGQRIYRLDAVTEVPLPAGAVRAATMDDFDLLVRWTEAFNDETGSGGGSADLDGTIRRRIGDGWMWVWDDGGVVATALVAPMVAGAARVGFVYTDPDHRGRGYAQGLVAALSRRALAEGATVCLLYTQLANATSNGIYRRIGYRAVSEVLRYRFAQA
jgi:ribosomal protein S18 acetylase RimI-like enzyme